MRLQSMTDYKVIQHNSIPRIIEHNIDIFAISETKLDSSFPEKCQFLLEGMKKFKDLI